MKKKRFSLWKLLEFLGQGDEKRHFEDTGVELSNATFNGVLNILHFVSPPLLFCLQLSHGIFSYFWSCSKITLDWRKPENNRLLRWKNPKKIKPKRNKDGKAWRRLTWVTINELEKLRLNFSRCTNRDAAPLKKLHVWFWRKWVCEYHRSWPYKSPWENGLTSELMNRGRGQLSNGIDVTCSCSPLEASLGIFSTPM